MTADPRTVIRDKVAEALYLGHCRPDDPQTWHLTAEWVRDSWRRQADAAIAAHLEALEQTSRIDTGEQLDALPEGSVVLSDSGDIGDVYVAWPEHHLAGLYGPWYRSGYEVPCPSDEVDLPARVLYRPEES